MRHEPANAHTAQARSVARERASGESVSISELPATASIVNILGVDYVHTADETIGDLYLTTVGYHYVDHLQPHNWYETSWFRSQRRRLKGTGLTYAVPTRSVRGESLPLVVKFSRVGEEVPIDTDLIEDVLCCEFNGPFEEFSLVEELRHSRRGSPLLSIRTQLPLAIYVPPEQTQPSQSRRFQWRIARKVAQHPGIAIDIMRQYVVVYRWLPGIDASEAQVAGLLSEDEVRRLTDRATEETRIKGFSVLDMKAEHLIVEPTESQRLIAEDGRTRYGLVDFELLERTAEHYQELQAQRMETYERRRRELLGADGTISPDIPPPPANLHAADILGVPYLHGRSESTGGMLWVVGREPELFDYFLPERWRTTPQIRFIDTHESYFTTSRDNIRLVWKVSRVGEPPEMAAFGADGFQVLANGFNSPFEEVAAAWWLSRRGIPTILPRAIYRTGHRSQLNESLFDPSRYQTHSRFRSFDGEPILESRRNYITIWDFWSGPEAAGEEEDMTVSRSVNVSRAVERGLLNSRESQQLVAEYRDSLTREGVEVFRLVPAHILLSIDANQVPARDERGRLKSCLCNFQYLRLPTWPSDQPH